MTAGSPLHDVPVAVTGGAESSYIDWPAIIAGAILASATSLLLMTFGSAIGLSLTDPFGGGGSSLVWIGIIVAIWVVLVQVSSFAIGGYIAGRMRRRANDASEHEVDVRDGIHGLLVWATGLVLTAILAFGGLGTLAQTVGNAAGGLASGVAGAATEVAGEVADPFAASVDTLLRSEDPAAAGEADVRGEVGRILIGGVTGEGVSDADRTYLANVVAARTGLTPEEAQARVDEVIATAQSVQDGIAEAAETARRVGILAAFLTAASLAISAAGAYFAAGMGGSHRDKGTVVAFFTRRR